MFFEGELLFWPLKCIDRMIKFFASKKILISSKLINILWKFQPLKQFCRKMSKFAANPLHYERLVSDFADSGHSVYVEYL